MSETTPRYEAGDVEREDVLEKWANVIGERWRPREEWGSMYVAQAATIRDLVAEVRRLRARVAELEPDTTLGLRRVARCLRLGIVRQQFEVGNLTEAEALELLSGPLTPGDESTKVDDSALLHAKPAEILAVLKAAKKGEA